MNLSELTMIVATDLDGAIGKGNTLPWRHRGDMAHFKKTTQDSVVIMGNKTFQSMNNKTLKNRINLVLSRNYDAVGFQAPTEPDDITTLMPVRSVEDALATAKEHWPDKMIYVIGGASIYEAFLPATDVIIQTRLDLRVEGADTFFPFHQIDPVHWVREVQEFGPGQTHPDDVAYEIIHHYRK